MVDKPGLTLYTEDAGGATVQLHARPSCRYPQRFATVFAPALATVARWDRPAAYWRTLAACLGRLDPIQARRVSAAELAEATGLGRASVERALSMLEGDGVIVATGKSSAKSRRLSRRVASMSSARRWTEEEEEAPDPELVDGRGR